MANELLIKAAAEYSTEQDNRDNSASNEFTAKAVKFINEVIKPAIEEKIAHPENFTDRRKHISRHIPVHPTKPFVAEVERLLFPLGFVVKESYDGNDRGFAATVEVFWGDSVPKISRKK